MRAGSKVAEVAGNRPVARVSVERLEPPSPPSPAAVPLRARWVAELGGTGRGPGGMRPWRASAGQRPSGPSARRRRGAPKPIHSLAADTGRRPRRDTPCLARFQCLGPEKPLVFARFPGQVRRPARRRAARAGRRNPTPASRRRQPRHPLRPSGPGHGRHVRRGHNSASAYPALRCQSARTLGGTSAWRGGRSRPGPARACAGRLCGVRTRLRLVRPSRHARVPWFPQIGRGAPEWPGPRSRRKGLAPAGPGWGPRCASAERPVLPPPRRTATPFGRGQPFSFCSGVGPGLRKSRFPPRTFWRVANPPLLRRSPVGSVSPRATEARVAGHGGRG
jgi:hypothetical protein